jgi:hypothetical protein
MTRRGDATATSIDGVTMVTVTNQRGELMSVSREVLTFVDIAYEWGGERGVSPDYVLGELVSAFWRGNLERGGRSAVFMDVQPDSGRGAGSGSPPIDFATRVDGSVVRIERDVAATAETALANEPTMDDAATVDEAATEALAGGAIVDDATVDEDRTETAERKQVLVDRGQLAKVVIGIFGVAYHDTDAELEAFAARPLASWPLILVDAYFKRFHLARGDFMTWARAAGYLDPKFWKPVEQPPRQGLVPQPRRIEDEARLRHKIETVLAAARRTWKPEKRPSINEMAKELAKSEKLEFKEGTIRVILQGRYPPQRRLGIKGLA